VLSHIWSAPVPEKIRIFAWRLASNGLAMMEKARRRDMETSRACMEEIGLITSSIKN